MSVYKYSLLRYKPSVQREEFINIGLVLHSPKHSILEFKLTNEWNRVKVFSGKNDISILKESALGIFDIFNQHQLLKEKSFDYSDDKLLENITRSMSGQLSFSSVRKLEAKNSPYFAFKYLFEINVSIKSIPRFDKKEQFNIKKAVRSIFREVTKSMYSLEHHITGITDHDVLEYDLITSDKLFKSFSFLNKDAKKLRQTIKALAFDAIELKRRKGYDTYLIYVNSENQYEIDELRAEINKYQDIINISLEENKELNEKICSLENDIYELTLQNDYLQEYFYIFREHGVNLINLHDFESFVIHNKESILDGLENLDDFLQKSLKA